MTEKTICVINALKSDDQFPNRYHFSDTEFMPDVATVYIHPNGKGIAKLLKPKNENSKCVFSFIQIDPDNPGTFTLEFEGSNHWDDINKIYERPGWDTYTHSVSFVYRFARDKSHQNENPWGFAENYNSALIDKYRTQNRKTYIKNATDLYNYSGVCQPFIQEAMLPYINWEKYVQAPLTETMVEKYLEHLKPFISKLNTRFLSEEFLKRIKEPNEIDNESHSDYEKV